MYELTVIPFFSNNNNNNNISLNACQKRICQITLWDDNNNYYYKYINKTIIFRAVVSNPIISCYTNSSIFSTSIRYHFCLILQS